jgi:hypothetical protein
VTITIQFFVNRERQQRASKPAPTLSHSINYLNALEVRGKCGEKPPLPSQL